MTLLKGTIVVCVVSFLFASVMPLAGAWNCDHLQWSEPLSWMAGNLQQKSYSFSDCSKMVIRSDIYLCSVVTPWVVCGSGQICPAGSVCGEGMFPQLCVTCSTTSKNPSFETQHVVTNSTAAMLSGKFWTRDEFYNHTGVDLILTMENWSWSPSGNALGHDFVQHHRSTWGDQSDYDSFHSYSEVFTNHNATHIQHQYSSVTRYSADKGASSVDSFSVVNFYPSSVPRL